MARLKPRDATATEAIERPPVPGLEPGGRYRRRRGAPVRWDRSPAEAHDEAGPVVTYVEAAPAGDKWEGLGGWFVDSQQRTHFYLADDVVEAGKAGSRPSGPARAEGVPDGDTCLAGDGRPRYSQGLCTTHYGRARKMVKTEGLSWDEAREAVKEAAPNAEGGDE